MQFYKRKRSFLSKELLPVYLENNQKVRKDVTKIDDYERGKRPKQVALETCLIGLRKRKQKLEQKLKRMQNILKIKHYLLLFLVGGKISMKE